MLNILSSFLSFFSFYSHSYFIFPQKQNDDNDIIFDDSPLDASEGHRFLSKRSIDQQDNDEHWLWTHVDRIKRSIHGIFNEDTKTNNRVKRDWWDSWLTSPTTEEGTTSTTTTEAIPAEIRISTTQANIDETKEDEFQDDHTEPEDSMDDDDSDNEIDGSGLHKSYETNDVYESKTERFCKYFEIKIVEMFFLLFFHQFQSD